MDAFIGFIYTSRSVKPEADLFRNNSRSGSFPRHGHRTRGWAKKECFIRAVVRIDLLLWYRPGGCIQRSAVRNLVVVINGKG